MTPSLVHLFRGRVRLGAHRPALRERRRGRWQSTTWGEWENRSRAAAAWLLGQGLDPGDRVGLLLSTRQAWFELDMAVLWAGAVTVPLYASLSPRQLAAQLIDAGVRWLVVDDPLGLERLLGEREAIAQLCGVIVIDRRGVRTQPDAEGRRSLDLEDLDERAPPAVAYDDALAAGEARLAAGASALLDQRAEALTPDTVASIVYTSGTDGAAKGVVLTHDNFLFEVEALERVFSLGPHDEQLLFLPMAHVFARILEMAQLRVGYLTTFSEGPGRLLDELPEVEPTFFGAVPRLFEQIYASAARSVEARRWGPLLWSQAAELGVEAARRRRAGQPLPLGMALRLKAADELVLSRVRGAFGRRLRFAFSGGAPLGQGLAEWFLGAGVLVLEGYGLTETTSASHVNTPADPCPGAVGQPLPGVEARLAPDGEVLVRGRNVCKGYYNRPDLTRQLIDDEGWLHTGDEGRIEGATLRIVGRKKELLVTSGGHKVAPGPLEASLQQSSWIQRAVLVGEGRPCVGALLALREDTAFAWARANDRPADLAALAHDPAVRALLQTEIDAVNHRVASFERVRSFCLLEGPLDDEALTPTGKLRRELIQQRYADSIEQIYGAPSPPPPLAAPVRSPLSAPPPPMPRDEAAR